MITRTSHEYDIKHTGDEMERLEILSAFNLMAKMIEDAGLASVDVQSVKCDLITVTVTTVEQPW